MAIKEHHKNMIGHYINATLRYVWLGSRLPKKKPPFLLVDSSFLEPNLETDLDLYVYGRLNTFIRVKGVQVKKKSAMGSTLVEPVSKGANTFFTAFSSIASAPQTYIHKAFFLEAQSLDMLRIVERVMAASPSLGTFLTVFPPLESFMAKHCTKTKPKKSYQFQTSELLRLQIEEVNAMLTEATLLEDTDLAEHGRNWNIF